MSEIITKWQIQFLMNNCWKFDALLAGNVKLITADLFAGARAHQLSTPFFSINQNNCKILVYLCVYTSDGSFVAQKLLWEAQKLL